MNMWSALVFIVCFIYSSSADSIVDWSVDEDSLPELLPDLMRNAHYNEEEIKKALFWAYKIQYDVISEHNGHVFDTKSPLSYFSDDLIIPKTRASAINSDVIFNDNTISGLTNLKKNKIVIKWSQDQVSTEVIWKELKIAGKYTFIDNLYFKNGEYQIFVEDVTYQAIMPLTKNTELYLSSALNVAITSYNKFRTTFIGNYSIPDEFSVTRYFLEEVAFRHVANYAMQATRNNVTAAIRAAVQPYVLYKNQSDPHFPGAAGRLDDGQGYVVDGPLVSGLDHVAQKVRSVWTDPGAVFVAVENTLHGLVGTFDLRVLPPGTTATGEPARGDRPLVDSPRVDSPRGDSPNISAAGDTVVEDRPAGTVTAVGFAVNRVHLSVTYDALRPDRYCTTAVRLYGATASPRDGNSGVGTGADEPLLRRVQQAAAAFFGAVEDHLSAGTCAAIAKTNEQTRPRRYPCYYRQPSPTR